MPAGVVVRRLQMTMPVPSVTAVYAYGTVLSYVAPPPVYIRPS